MGSCAIRGLRAPARSDDHEERSLPKEGDDRIIRINIQHVSGGTDAEGEWTLNNIIALDAHGTVLSHSEDSIIFESYGKGVSIGFDCTSNVRFVAFASQDMQSACIQITTPSDLAVPSGAFQTIHWSNDEHACSSWDEECNLDPTKWAYTVAPLHPLGMDESKIRSPFHASWSELSDLRSDGF